MRCHKVVDLLLEVGKPLRIDTCGDYGMVVGNLLVVEHLLRFHKRLAEQRHCERLIVAQSFKDILALGVDIIAQVCGVDTRIGCHLLLVERLNCLQCLLGRETELLVAVYLQ